MAKKPYSSVPGDDLVGADGLHVFTTTAASATAGAAGAPPAQVVGYLTVSVNGTTFKVPYYNV